MPHTLESLPSETIVDILAHVPDTDLLAVRLTSSILLAHSKKRDGTYLVDLRKSLSKDQLNRVHVAIERSWPKKRYLDIRICTTCQKLKDQDSFSDGHWKHLPKDTSVRECIICSLQHRSYEVKNFKFRGRQAFACQGCLKPRLIDEEVVWLPEGSAEKVQLERLKERFENVEHQPTRFCHHCVTFCIEENNTPSGISVLKREFDNLKTVDDEEQFHLALAEYTPEPFPALFKYLLTRGLK